MGVKLKPEDISELVWKAVTVTNGWKRGVHFTAKRDLDVFIRLAGFQGLSRPLMRRFAKM